jgi:hypothetical protein
VKASVLPKRSTDDTVDMLMCTGVEDIVGQTTQRVIVEDLFVEITQ